MDNSLILRLRDFDGWHTRYVVRFYAPSAFNAEFPTTQFTIDGTESSKFKLNQQLTMSVYSSYENRNTVIAVKGVTPSGMFSFDSDIYGKSVSDRHICECPRLVTMSILG